MRNSKTLKAIIREIRPEARRFWTLSEKLKAARNEEKELDVMAELYVSASVLKAKFESISREIDRITDSLEDEDGT
jgi:hypothetical protein